MWRSCIIFLTTTITGCGCDRLQPPRTVECILQITYPLFMREVVLTVASFIFFQNSLPYEVPCTYVHSQLPTYMPITFGSVGDIISVCLLVKDLVNTLNDSRGSSTEYQEVIRELGILDRTLLEVEIFVRTHENTIELNALCETARRSVENSQRLVERFFERAREYEASLGGNSRGSGRKGKNVVRRAARKVQWRVGEKEELDKFRAEIAANSASLSMLLAAASVKLQTINSKKIDDGLKRSDWKTHDAFQKQGNTLQEIIRTLEETNRLIMNANAASGSSGMQGRAAWANKLAQEMKNLMLEVIATNLATYKAVIDIQRAAPTRSITEETFLLEDAIGRVAPVPSSTSTPGKRLIQSCESDFGKGRASIKC
ncbi:hypothetical protein K469DRAFT_779826 [Zopfia rhizophila CBS 207.26]|uniref:Fungal N-terminal domain-containing protein n=1 Tax=Zopfia rhizophila CBS 207.26 TaxID=1314779 RepID=A0A6A6E4J5_9PEZI|nr:hypothetical protein K469DRAFT_779826 [Zopfia rhizophila CBS 207.26]